MSIALERCLPRCAVLTRVWRALSLLGILLRVILGGGLGYWPDLLNVQLSLLGAV